MRIESVALTVRGEVDVEMRNPSAEHVDIDHFGCCLLLEGRAHPGQHFPEGARLLAAKVGDMRNVPFRLQVGKAGDLGLKAHRQPPQSILPNLHTSQLGVAIGPTAQYAIHKCGISKAGLMRNPGFIQPISGARRQGSDLEQHPTPLNPH